MPGVAPANVNVRLAKPTTSASWFVAWLGRDWFLGYLFLIPVLAVLLGLIAYPVILAVRLSLTNTTIGGSGRFVGLGNYSYLLLNDQFLKSVTTSAVYTVCSVGLKFVLGMTAALVINSRIKARNMWRALLFVPWTIPTVVGAFTWRWLYDDTNGVLNPLLTRLHVMKDFVYWLADPHIALYAVIAAVIWAGMPFYTMNLLAGMQAIPHELYEAVDIDGAGAATKFLHVTLPGLANVTLITVLLSTIWTANELQFVYVLTQGGPAGATLTFPYLAYEISMAARELGRGAAVPLMLFPLFSIIIYLLTRQMLRTEVD